jgi:[acyl-carrier-protein] S-malonyltransferase
VAGHSLGEFTAYLAAGVLGFAESIRLVHRRGELMKLAGEQNPGAMAAVLGLDPEKLRSACTESGSVWLANDNCPGQTVLSGTKTSLDRALKLAQEKGARRVVPLAVSIAGHCPLMAPAAQSLADYLQGVQLERASTPVIANVTGRPIAEPEEIRAEIVAHLTSGVQWVESIRYMVAEGVQTFLEIGPKSVLCGLVRQIDRSVQAVNVSTLSDIDALGA